MESHGHKTVIARCGHVIMQCRCFMVDKPTEYLDVLCTDCKARAEAQQKASWAASKQSCFDEVTD